MNLRFCYMSAHDAGAKGHAQKVMRDLGITYKVGIAQSLGDQWWFGGCENVPDPLPPYISILTLSPDSEKHWGLDAKSLANTEPGKVVS